MKKVKLLGTLLCAACLVTGSIAPSVPVMADGMNVVTLEAGEPDTDEEEHHAEIF